MSKLAARALGQIGDALTAFRRYQACEFNHPHPSHPCGKRVTLTYLKQAEAAGDTCALEKADQSALCTFKPLHQGRHSWGAE